MTMMTKKKWTCVEVQAKEEDGRNSATVFLQGEDVRVADVIGVLEKAFQHKNAKTGTLKRRGKGKKRQPKTPVKAGA